ncbi:MAG: hypothetical protein AVDCRST_MAG85-3848, partial [uncultured Solirubrobacteraceae bacterium]
CDSVRVPVRRASSWWRCFRSWSSSPRVCGRPRCAVRRCGRARRRRAREHAHPRSEPTSTGLRFACFRRGCVPARACSSPTPTERSRSGSPSASSRETRSCGWQSTEHASRTSG